MTALIDMANFRAGRLVASRRDCSRASRRVFWICRCDCGVVVSVSGIHLRQALVRSCGCLNRETLAKRNAIANAPAIQDERWREAIGASSYQVSDHGRVRGKYGEIKRGYLDKNGYPMVGLKYDDGQTRSAWVHKLVALAFLGPCPPGKECDHIDRDRANATLLNLRYVTHQQNIDNSAGSAGEAHGLAKLTEAEVREILAIPPAPRWGRRGKGNHPNSVITIAERYGISNVTVLQIRRGERWRHVFEQMLPLHPHLADLAKRRRVEPSRKKPGATAPNQTVHQAEPQPT